MSTEKSYIDSLTIALEDYMVPLLRSAAEARTTYS